MNPKKHAHPNIHPYIVHSFIRVLLESSIWLMYNKKKRNHFSSIHTSSIHSFGLVNVLHMSDIPTRKWLSFFIHSYIIHSIIWVLLESSIWMTHQQEREFIFHPSIHFDFVRVSHTSDEPTRKRIHFSSIHSFGCC